MCEHMKYGLKQLGIQSLIWAHHILWSKNWKEAGGYGVWRRSAREQLSYLHWERVFKTCLSVPWIGNIKSKTDWNLTLKHFWLIFGKNKKKTNKKQQNTTQKTNKQTKNTQKKQKTKINVKFKSIVKK